MHNIQFSTSVELKVSFVGAKRADLRDIPVLGNGSKDFLDIRHEVGG